MFTKTAFAALAALSLAASVHAEPASQPVNADKVSVSISVADLNLTSQAGARVALQRVRNAARTICGDEPDNRDQKYAGQFQACVQAVVDRAVATLGAPMVSAANKGQTATVLASTR
jgi:UrcA family protein